MKKRVFLFMLIGLTSMSVFSQWFGLAHNPNSALHSGFIIAEIKLLWTKEEKRVKESVEEFNKNQYGKRLKYYAGSTLANVRSSEIDDIITKLETRISQLNSKNQGALFYFKYKKERNKDAIKVVSNAIDILKDKLGPLNHHTLGVKWGELVNLKQNLEISSEVLNRKLDAIESDIDNSTFLSDFMKK